MTLYDKLNKQKELREKLVLKKEDVIKKIEQVDDKIKIIQEDIENQEMDNTLKVIKSKGYSILEVKEALEGGVLDDLLKKNNFI
ncbi:hypothetical protein J2Z76_002573 [Sedimentibacter acidaminivorans]|uniref:Flagellar export protein FliJ n=1 Tax=Sedimentibacter acidaminivorans TaxID=913099 RepID=A0ABS4GG88_9FIRM|nr:hypothetical protein [Sedimentibacter acidaminivorans]MBP1926703.1 hypothetical protein [Sedimentibacter acidaminivorans]